MKSQKMRLPIRGLTILDQKEFNFTVYKNTSYLFVVPVLEYWTPDINKPRELHERKGQYRIIHFTGYHVSPSYRPFPTIKKAIEFFDLLDANNPKWAFDTLESENWCKAKLQSALEKVEW